MDPLDRRLNQYQRWTTGYVLEVYPTNHFLKETFWSNSSDPSPLMKKFTQGLIIILCMFTCFESPYSFCVGINLVRS